MLTGVQLVKEGSVSFAQGSSKSIAGGFTVPLPDPATQMVASASGNGALSTKAERNAKMDSESAYGYQDSRVWAAQFMKLKVKLRRQIVGEQDGQTAGEWIRLRQLDDLRRDGVRNKKIDESDSEQPLEDISTSNVKLSHVVGKDGEEIDGDLMGVDWRLVDRYVEYVSALAADEQSGFEDDDEDDGESDVDN